VSTRNDLPDIEQELRGATNAYADLFEPAPDSWAQLRARADEATPRHARRRIFGIGGLAIATAAAALAIMLPGDGTDEAIDVDLPTATQPTTTVERQRTADLWAEWHHAGASGIARFFRTGEPGAADEWTVELNVGFADNSSYIFAREYERIVLRLSPGEADLEHELSAMDVCSSPPPGDDGRITCTGTFPASLVPDALPFGPDWSATLSSVEAGRYLGLSGTQVAAPIDADFSAAFISNPEAEGTAFFRLEDDGVTWTAWVDATLPNACWPPGAPPGEPTPCVERFAFQVGLPFTDASSNGYQLVDVCEVELRGNGEVSCTGTFSGAAGENWSEFSTSSVALLRGQISDRWNTLDQVDVAPRIDVAP
jgi:hypothetical protein